MKLGENSSSGAGSGLSKHAGESAREARSTMLTSFIRRSRAALAIIVCATASLSAQVILEPRIASETLPSGGLMQIKMDLTSPHPIIVGNAQFEIADSFDGFEGASLFSPSRDAYGVAFLRGRTLVANIVSPLQSLGTQLDYPFLVIASRIKAGIPRLNQWEQPCFRCVYRKVKLGLF